MGIICYGKKLKFFRAFFKFCSQKIRSIKARLTGPRHSSKAWRDIGPFFYGAFLGPRIPEICIGNMLESGGHVRIRKGYHVDRNLITAHTA